MSVEELAKLKKDELIKMVSDLQADKKDLIQSMGGDIEEHEKQDKRIQFYITEGMYNRLKHFADGHKTTPNKMAKSKVLKFLGFTVRP